MIIEVQFGDAGCSIETDGDMSPEAVEHHMSRMMGCAYAAVSGFEEAYGAQYEDFYDEDEDEQAYLPEGEGE